MVPPGTLIDVENILGPGLLKRHNLFRSATVTAVPAPGLSSGDAITEVAQTALSLGYQVEWTGSAPQQLASGGIVVVIPGLAVLFAICFMWGGMKAGRCRWRSLAGWRLWP